ncbi:MAG: GTP 3',8-cyclase MoaA, partial [Dehalococcoidia bacterium]|nr:GTP 3',8-cyclase MoaA [Dehalococcoidia bacterium]
SNYPGEVANRYRYRAGQGELGVISSVSQPFCANCTRSRLSTDGKLYPCLFASTGVSLRDEMRAGASDDDLKNLIARIWTRRTDRYSEERTELASLQNVPAKVEMYQIGG